MGGGDPPTGPFAVHMWTCAQMWSASQTWSYNATTKMFSDPRKEVCLNAGKDNNPDMGPCNPSDKSQQWSFAEGGSITSANGLCLAVEPQQAGMGGADQYMMGDAYMVAPILNLGQRSREVYFPTGTDWVHHFTGKRYHGGSTATVDAPLENFPLFKRVDAIPPLSST